MVEHFFNDMGSVAQVAIVLGAILTFCLSYEHRITIAETAIGTTATHVADHETRIRTLEKA